MSSAEIKKSTTCHVCHVTLKYATQLVLHLLVRHRIRPEVYLRNRITGVQEGPKARKKCRKCLRMCPAPLAFALHWDRHQVRDVCIRVSEIYMMYHGRILKKWRNCC